MHALGQEVTIPKKRDQEKDLHLKTREAYVQNLEKDLALQRTHGEDLQHAYDGASSRLSHIYDDHKCTMERASDAALQQGKTLGLQESMELGSAMVPTDVSLTC